MPVQLQLWSRFSSLMPAGLYGLGGLGVLLLAICDSSFISVPEGNDLLIVILSAGSSWGTMAYYVAMTTAGSVIGCVLLYSVGRKGGSPILKKRFSPERVCSAERLFQRYGILTVLIPSILPPPLPFKIFVLSAGVFRLNVMTFLFAVFVGRTIRYSMWGVLAVLYGNPVKQFMQKNLWALGTGCLIVFFGIAIISTAYCIRRFRAAKAAKPNAHL